MTEPLNDNIRHAEGFTGGTMNLDEWKQAKQQWEANGISWRATTVRIDIQTGEKITARNAQENYIKLKTTKHVTINNIKTKGHIEYTIQYTRNPQQQFKFD